MLGTNGGGFFNANAAHPFENPTPLSNLLEIVLFICSICAALTYTSAGWSSDQRQGWAVWPPCSACCLVGIAVCYWAEATAARACRRSASTSPLGNMEGKEVRFGVATPRSCATVTTAASLRRGQRHARQLHAARRRWCRW